MLTKTLLIVLLSAISFSDIAVYGVEKKNFKSPKAKNSGKQLLFVAELFRHGARYSLGDSGFWNADEQIEVQGELSPTGLRQHYTFGQLLRQEYVDDRQFLPPEYNHTFIRIFSTDVNRTLMSAYAHLQGLYPPAKGPQISPNLLNYSLLLPAFKNVQPVNLGNYSLPQLMQVVPVHTLLSVENQLLEPWATCPKLDSYEQWYYTTNTAWMNKVNTAFAKTYSQLDKVLGLPAGTISFLNMEDVWDVLICDTFNGLPVPPQMTTQLWNNLTALDTLYWFAQFGANANTSQVINSHLLANIVALFNTSINGGNPLLKFAIFSGHDTNVASLMYGLNISNIDCVTSMVFNRGNKGGYMNCFFRPYFAANIILELYNTTTSNVPSYEVMIRYDGEYVYVCNSTSYSCDFYEFVSRLNYNTIITQNQWDQLCGIPSSTVTDEQIQSAQQQIVSNLVQSESIPTIVENKHWILKLTIAIESVVLFALGAYAVSFLKWGNKKK